MAFALYLLVLLAPAVLGDTPLTQQLQRSHFSGFLKLLEHADLVPEIEGALNSGKTLTVFAPTDEALMYNTSPTLLAFLKLSKNKDSLRKLLLSHIVAEKLSPFQWEGTHVTLQGTTLKLSMDASSFYASDVAVKKYNALSSPEFSVHSLPALIIPSEMSASAKSFVEEVTEVRRVLQAAAPAPSTAEDTPSGQKGPVTMPQPDDAISSGTSAQAVASLVTLAAALAVALF